MRSPIRLLVITELFLPTKGGTAVWFDAVYRRLGGKAIHVLTADVPGADAIDHDHPNTIHRVSLRRYAWLKPESLAMYLKLFFSGMAIALRNRVEAVHAGRVLPEGLVAWLIARLCRVPLVIYAHGEEITTWRQSGKFKAMAFAYRHADQVVANSDFTFNELVKLGVRPANIVMIHPGVDTDFFQPGLNVAGLRASASIPEATFMILSVGRLSRRKGFDYTLQAVARLVKVGHDIHYALIGIGEDDQYLRQLTDELGIQNRVHFLGHVAPEDLPRWYNTCDVFIMPNREIDGDTEGFGMVFVEAAACGKPAIGGQAGGTGAAILDDVTGLRVNGENIDDIIAALKRIMTEQGLAQRLGETGAKRAHTELSWDAITRKTRMCIINASQMLNDEA